MQEFLSCIFVQAPTQIFEAPVFFAEVVISGLLVGVMYSLVALGFVLIFKASGIFNFAQGTMVLFAALTLVGLMELGIPIWLAMVFTIAVMIVLAIVVERVVLRPLVNQDLIILFMATIGLNFVLEGLGETLWGSNVKKLDIGIPEVPWEINIGQEFILLNSFDVYAAGIGAVLVISLAVFFQKTSIGRALRAVADDHVGRHTAQTDLGDRVVGRGHCRACCRHHVGSEERRAVFPGPDRLEGIAGVDPGWF